MTTLIYSLAGVGLIAIALFRVVAESGVLRRIVAINVFSVGVAYIFIADAYRGPGAPADPVPHAFVLTGIVVLVATTAVALALVRRLHDGEGRGDDG